MDEGDGEEEEETKEEREELDMAITFGPVRTRRRRPFEGVGRDNPTWEEEKRGGKKGI